MPVQERILLHDILPRRHNFHGLPAVVATILCPIADQMTFHGFFECGGEERGILLPDRWPAKVKSESICADTTCLTDLLATCADIVGTKLPVTAGEDSVSMLPNLLGTAKKSQREATIHHSIDGTFAIRQDQWKLITAPHSGGWTSPRQKEQELWKDLPKVQLYDLETDPAETTNVQDQHPEVVERLKELIQNYKKNKRSTPVPVT
jgi:arylsulfatase A